MHKARASGHRRRSSQYWLWAAGVVLVLALAAKFLWPLFAYSVPLGYDAGIYRYLFLHHAEGFPPFVLAPLPDWAKGHPLGLFFFTTVLVRAGLPVDWLIGWMWNLVPVVLACVLAGIMEKREGPAVGLLTLLAALLSVAFFDAFGYMYWETLVSLLFCVITYHLLEKKSWWAVCSGLLTVVIHNQTGFLFGLVFLSWAVILIASKIRAKKKWSRDVTAPLLVGAVVFLLGLLWYLPIWTQAIKPILPQLLTLNSTASGNFPPALFYLQTSGILLTLGIVGLFLSFKRERFTLWQLSVVWCLIFVCFHLFFFRRFFLQLDFFLLPFAAIAIRAFWLHFSTTSARAALIIILLLQAVSSARTVISRVPIIDAASFSSIKVLPDEVPANATVIDLENQTAPFVLGWLPDNTVGGPGLFASSWSYSEWMQFIRGEHQDRLQLLSPITGDIYLYASPAFHRFYGDQATAFLLDPCFMYTGKQYLYKVVCR